MTSVDLGRSSRNAIRDEWNDANNQGSGEIAVEPDSTENAKADEIVCIVGLIEHAREDSNLRPTD